VVAAVGLFGLVAQGQAAPTVAPGSAVGTPTIMMVRDYCGKGYYRPNKTRDKWGAWRGKCVPIKKKADPVGQAEQPAAAAPSR